MLAELPPALLAALTAMTTALVARAWVQPEVRHWLGPEAPALAGPIPHLLVALLAVGVAMASLVQQPSLQEGLALGVYGGLLTTCALTDLRCRLLPDRLTLSLAALGLLLPILGIGPGLWSALAGAAFGYGMPWLVGRLMRRGRGHSSEGAAEEVIGRGDLALLGAMGLWVGFSGLPMVLIGACLVMLPLVAWGMLRRGWTRTTALPFGPSLCLAGTVVLPWVLQERGLS